MTHLGVLKNSLKRVHAFQMEVLVFKKRGKPGYPEKNLSEQRREPATNSADMWRGLRDFNQGYIGEGECSHHCATLDTPPPPHLTPKITLQQRTQWNPKGQGSTYKSIQVMRMTINQHIWTNVDKTKYFSFRQVQLVCSRHALFFVVIKRRYGLFEALRQLAIVSFSGAPTMLQRTNMTLKNC